MAETWKTVAFSEDVQAYDAGLTNLAGVAMASDKFYYTTADNTHVAGTVTSAARSILDDTTVGAIRTTLGVGVTDAPSLEGMTLTGIGADSPVLSGDGTTLLLRPAYATTGIFVTSTGIGILDDSNDYVLTVGGEIGLRGKSTDAVASNGNTVFWHANGSGATGADGDLIIQSKTGAGAAVTVNFTDQLAPLATMSTTDGVIAVRNGTHWVAESGATARTSLGLGAGDSPVFAGASLGTGELTCGSINRASGSLTLEIGGTAKLSISSTVVAIADQVMTVGGSAFRVGPGGAGTSNTCVGQNTGAALTSGTTNVFIGANNGQSITEGTTNVLIGAQSGPSMVGNTGNLGIGNQTLYALITGDNNTAIGNNAMSSTTSASNNVAIGQSALTSVTGQLNVAIGYTAGGSVLGGTQNLLVGYSAGNSITTGSYNTILGNYSGSTTLANHVILADGAGNVAFFRDSSGNCGLGGVTNPQEDVHVSDTVRADTWFNHNGTDGITTTFLDQDGNTITVNGGIITAKTAP